MIVLDFGYCWANFKQKRAACFPTRPKTLSSIQLDSKYAVLIISSSFSLFVLFFFFVFLILFLFWRNRPNIWCYQEVSIGAVAHYVQIGGDVGRHLYDIVFSIQRCCNRNINTCIESHLFRYQIWIIPEAWSWPLCIALTRLVTASSSRARLVTAQRCSFAYS